MTPLAGALRAFLARALAFFELLFGRLGLVLALLVVLFVVRCSATLHGVVLPRRR